MTHEDGNNRQETTPKSSRRFILFIIVVPLLVSIAANAGWETVVKPGGKFLGNVLFTLTTLGFTSARDDLYQEAAKGFHEHVALSIFSLVVFGISLGGGFLIGSTMTVMKLKKGEAHSKWVSSPWSNWAIPRLFLLMIVTGLLFAVFRQYSASFSNNLVTTFEQQMNVAAPHLKELDRLELRAKFASMKSKEDYDAIMNDLNLVITKAQAHLPATIPAH